MTVVLSRFIPVSGLSSSLICIYIYIYIMLHDLKQCVCGINNSVKDT